MSECAYSTAETTGQPAASPCPRCQRVTGRLPLTPAATRVYDALFGEGKPLAWSEADDCGMNTLMRDVAEAAAAAAFDTKAVHR